MSRLPGLVYGTQRVEVESVTPRHTSRCVACNRPPVSYRLHIACGAGRGAKSYVYCDPCAVAWLLDRRLELNNAVAMIKGEGQAHVRLPPESQAIAWPPPVDQEKKQAQLKRKAEKLRKAALE